VIVIIKTGRDTTKKNRKMRNTNKHMNVVIWKQQFSNCSYPRTSHTDSDVLLDDLTTI
jgi:hypothetical protein